jgi:STE24 endopeptidase
MLRQLLPALGLALLLAGPPAATDRPAPAARGGPVAIPEPSEKASRYHRTGNWLWGLVQVWTLAVPAALLVTGTSARLRDLAWKVGRRWVVAVAIYAALYIALVALINLPLTYYLGFVRPHEYGLSDESFGHWLRDATVRLLVAMLMGALFLWVPYALLARSPRRWWLYTGLLAVPFSFGMVLVKPAWYDPLFNRFGPMEDKRLEARIVALAERAGVSGARVYQVDKSRETRTVNAYVTGFLGTKRIVLWDTTLARLAPEEVLCVMGHELGHYVLGHVVLGTSLSCVLTLAGLAFVHVVSGALIRHFRGRFGFDRPADVASLPLLFLLGHLFFLATTPLSYAVSRSMEHEADRFALEITRDNYGCASAFVKFQQDNLSYPSPHWLYKVWRATHPPMGERIAFCNAYRPWERGEPGRYEGYFRGAVGRR